MSTGGGGGDVIGGIEVQLTADGAQLEAGFAKARQAMAAIERQIAQLTAEEAKGAITTADYTAQVAGLNAGLARLTTGMAAAASRTNALDTAMAGITTGAKFNAQSMMFLGQAVDDLQFGFSAIVNQVPQLLMSVGMGAGLAGAASIAAVAVNQLAQRWGDLQEAMGLGLPVPALEGLERLEARAKEIDKRIEELRAKKRLSLPESGELADLTGERARVKAAAEAERELARLTGGRSEEETARGSAFAGAVREAGGATALGQLELYLEQMADAKGRVGVLGAETGTPAAVARELFVNAAKGDEAALGSILKALPPRNEFRRAIVEASPETKARREAEDRFEKEGHDRALADEKAREKDRADLLAGEGADAAEDEAHAEKYARDKIKNRERLTEGERGAATEETRQAEREMIRDEGERAGTHADRLNALNRRLGAAARGEPRTSQVMDASQLWASIQSSVSNAPSSMEKRLIEMNKIQEDIRTEIAKFNRPVQAGK